MPPSDDKRTPTGVYLRDWLVCTYAGWQKIITYIFDGEEYSYAFPLGGVMLTAREALAAAIADGCEHDAQHQFLTEVEINPRVLH